MLMEDVSTYWEFNLHLSVTHTANICRKSREHLQKASLSEEATEKMRRSQSTLDERSNGDVFSHREWLLASLGKTEHSSRNTCAKMSFSKNTAHLLLSSSTDLSHSKGATYPESEQASKSDTFLWCAQASLWLKIISCLYWVQQHGYANMHLFIWWRKRYTNYLAERRMCCAHSGIIRWYWWKFQSFWGLGLQELQTLRWHADSSIHLMNAQRLSWQTKGTNNEMRSWSVCSFKMSENRHPSWPVCPI